MLPESTPAIEHCHECGGPLGSGPLGLRCARCAIAMAVEGNEEDEALGHVAELFPELRVEGQLARGGFGTVYRAEHRRMRRMVALKFLDGLLAHSREAVDLFEQEMVTVGGLDHPGIVRAYDAGEREGRWFIMMELVEGLDCGALVRKHGRLPVAEACEIIRQAALALAHAHQRGLVHRDVKPGNLMVTRPSTPHGSSAGSEVKVLDFGLAGISVGPALGPAAAGETSAPGRMVIGTLEYVAPEQIEHPESTDARADLYSLGATLWRLLTGRLPRQGTEQSLFRQMRRIVSEPIPPIQTARPDLPHCLSQLCNRLLALDPGDRPATATELAKLLEPWCAGAELHRLFTEGPLPEKPFADPSIPMRRRRLVALAGISLFAGAIASVLVGSGLIPTVPDSRPPTLATRRGVLPAAVLAERKLPALAAPFFATPDWELESATSVPNDAQGARMLPDGGLAYLSAELLGSPALQLRRIGNEAPIRSLRAATAPYCFGVSPDTGHFIWAQPEAPKQRHLGRARPDTSPLPGLSFEIGNDFDPSQREELRLLSRRNDEGDGERRPAGFAFVREGQIPPETNLQPGDVLIADEGHRWLSPGNGGAPDRRGRGALWRCRLDNNAPAQRLMEDDRLLEYPLDVAVSRHGVFLLNRQEINPAQTAGAGDRTRRVVRWDSKGFHACTTDLMIHDPSGLAADPFSADLFVVEGAMLSATQPAAQRLLHLRRVEGDRFEAHVVARNFGRIGLNGIAFTPDGRRLVLTDRGNRLILVLKRTVPNR